MGPMNNQDHRPPFSGQTRLPPWHGLSLWRAWPTASIVGLMVMLMLGDFALQIVFYALGGGLFWPVLLGSIGGVFGPVYLIARRYALPYRVDFSLHWPPRLIMVDIVGASFTVHT